jgi:hypothetical protein
MVSITGESRYDVYYNTPEGKFCVAVNFPFETELICGSQFTNEMTKIIKKSCSDKETVAVFTNDVSIVKIH